MGVICQIRPETLVVVAPPSVFGYTGALQTYTVPAGITYLLVDMSGAAGADRQALGGKGGRLRCYLPVTPGEVLNLYVGNVGATGTATTYNGGGGGGVGQNGNGGAGGGATDIRRGGTALANRILVAGGGGGAGNWGYDYNTGGKGGDGGEQYAAHGVGGSANYAGSYGFGGRPTVGGATGSTSMNGTAGALGTGGTGGGTSSNYNGGAGGGGGGLYGGGGGSSGAGGSPNYGGGGGGGGGSSYADWSALDVVYDRGYRAGAGTISLTPMTTVSVVAPVGGAWSNILGTFVADGRYLRYSTDLNNSFVRVVDTPAVGALTGLIKLEARPGSVLGGSININAYTDAGVDKGQIAGFSSAVLTVASLSVEWSTISGGAGFGRVQAHTSSGGGELGRWTPFTPYVDTFNRVSDATPLNGDTTSDGRAVWETLAGTPNIYISSNTAQKNATNDSSFVIPTGMADVEVKATLLTPTLRAGLVFRAVDASNYWYYIKDPSMDRVSITRVLAGTPTTVTVDVGAPVGASVELRVVAKSNVIKYYYDGALIRTETSTNFMTAVKHGIFATSNNAQLNDFTVSPA